MTDDNTSLVRRTALPKSSSQPLTTPLYAAVAYTSEDADALDRQYEGVDAGFTYAREGHPNADVLAAKIDWLEGAEGGIITGSGMAALSAIYLGLLNSGDHIIAGDQLYGRNIRILKQELPRFGVTTSFVDPTDALSIERAVTPQTKMILLEVVANPTLRIADMTGIAKVAKDHGLLLVVDNTFTTPAAYRPFDHGADIVMHSVTKLLAGHSDVTLGYVAAKDPAVAQPIREAVATWGMTPSPFDSWQAERGLHSFQLRFEKAQANAIAIADRLTQLDAVETVLYPGRTDHPDHNRARAILGDNPGNMVSFRIKGGRKEANRFVRAAKNIPFAPTLGDIATTISHSASSSHRAMPPNEREAIGITEGFFRISVGIEDEALLVREFTEALEATAL